MTVRKNGFPRFIVTSYDSTTLDEQLSINIDVSNSSVPFESQAISLTTDGLLFYALFNNGMNNATLFAVQTERGLEWEFASIFSIIVLILSLLFAFGLMIKHKIAGADPSGWNKKKIPDLLATLVTILGIIIITVINGYAQTSSASTIQTNTVPFSMNLGEFYNEYMGNCSSSSTGGLPSNISLCTCNDPDDIYRTSNCTPSFCSNSANYQCSSLLQQSCDCKDSIYIWSCDCSYNVDGSCSANATSTSNYNSIPNDTWNQCRKSFSVPSFILTFSFYYSIVASSILVLLLFIQILLKFDFPLLDLLLTICSLFFAFSQFFLILIGKAFISSPTCVETLMSVLPACSLTAAGSQVTSMEVTAAAYLNNAYNNLLTAPLMFIISALPDLLSLFICIKTGGSEHKEALLKLIGKENSDEDYALMNSVNGESSENSSANTILLVSCVLGFLFNILGICCVFCVPNNRKTYIIGCIIDIVIYYGLVICFGGYFFVS